MTRAQALDHPDDPVLAFMRAQGTLMAPRWCNNGTLLPQRRAEAVIDELWGPVWMVDTEAQALRALVDVARLAPVQQAEGVSR